MDQAEAQECLLVIDDRKLRQAAIVSLLKPWAEMHRVAIDTMEAGKVNAEAGCSPASRLILINVGGNRVADPENTRLIRLVCAIMPSIPVVILSDLDDAEDVLIAFEIGAHGFLPTNLDPEIALQALSFMLHGGSFFPSSALHHVANRTRPGQRPAEASPAVATAPAAERELRDPHPAQSESPVAAVQGSLTERQQHVLKLLCTGQSNKMIARELKMTEATVKVHIRHVMRKLGAANRTEAAILATRLDLGQAAIEHQPEAEVDLGMGSTARREAVAAGHSVSARAGMTWTNTFGIRFRRRAGFTSVTAGTGSHFVVPENSLDEPEALIPVTKRIEPDE